MSERDPRIDSAFKELDGALCIWARAKGENPAPEYFHEVTPNIRRVIIGDAVYQMILTVADEDTK